MKTKSKVWLGVGAFIMVGTSAAGGAPLPLADTAAEPQARGTPVADVAGTAVAPVVVAQHVDHGQQAGEGGEAKDLSSLPPDLAFAVSIALLRGHLLIGDELVRQQQWNAALPHFLHPTEEIYGNIEDQLADYKVPSFDSSLKALAGVVKAKKSADYPKALIPVNDALAAADAGMKTKQANWPGFVVEAAIETLKIAANEYQQAIVGGRIAKPVEYQDARGFIRQAERMINSVAADLQKQDAAAFNDLHAGLAELQKAFPSPMPPRAPVKDHAAVLGLVSRIELAAGKLM